MQRFVIEEEFWSLFPEAQIGIVVARGVDNSVSDPEKYEKLLQEAAKAAQQYFGASEFSQNQVVAVWRSALQKFKTKKGARSSVEALLKRVSNGNPVGSINPLVDIYNAVSLRHALPCGGEDLDCFEGDIRLTKADGSENFVPLGSTENEPPAPGEIVYKDNAGAICRCWNWREAQRTMLTGQTRNAFLCIELVDRARADVLSRAVEDLAGMVADNLGGTTEIRILDRDHREMVIGD